MPSKSSSSQGSSGAKMTHSAADEGLDETLSHPTDEVKNALSGFLRSATDANGEKIPNSVNNLSEKMEKAGYSDRANEYKNVAVNFDNAKDKNTKIIIANALAKVMLGRCGKEIISTSIGVLGTVALLAHIAANGTVVLRIDSNFDGMEDKRGISMGSDGHVDHVLQDTDFDGRFDTVTNSYGHVEAAGPLVEATGPVVEVTEPLVEVTEPLVEAVEALVSFFGDLLSNL